MPESPAMMSIAEICRETGFDRSALSRFLGESVVRRWLGGEYSHPSYPRTSLPAFEWMRLQHERGIKPRPLSIAVADIGVGATPGQDKQDREAAADDGENTREAVEVPAPALDTFGGLVRTEQVNEALDYFVDRLAGRLEDAGVLPVREDRLLTREEAAALLACPPGAVGRRVRPVLPGTWSWIELQDYMRDLRARPRKVRARKQC